MDLEDGVTKVEDMDLEEGVTKENMDLEDAVTKEENKEYSNFIMRMVKIGFSVYMIVDMVTDALNTQNYWDVAQVN